MPRHRLGVALVVASCLLPFSPLLVEAQASNSQQSSNPNATAPILRRVIVKHHGFDDATLNDVTQSGLESDKSKYVQVDRPYDQKNANDMSGALENFWKTRGIMVKVVATLTPVPNRPRYSDLEFDVYKQ